MNLVVARIAAAVSGRLLQGDPGTEMKGVSIDSRSVLPGQLFIALKGERFDGHDFIDQALQAKAGGIMVGSNWQGRALPPHIPLIQVSDTLTALGDLARAWVQEASATIIAITGSNGKTTTREMTATILERSRAVLKPCSNWNNLIGLPLTLLRLTPSHQAAVLELGMNRRGEIKRLAQIAQPRIGVITNIGPVHLEHLKTIEEVARAKGELFESLDERCYAVFNTDDPRVAALADRCAARTISFGIATPARVRACDIVPSEGGTHRFTLVIGEERTPVSLPIPGLHSVYNALAAAAIASLCGTTIDEIRLGLEAYTPFPGRLEIIPLEDSITIINDTYNANPVSMEVALNTLAQLKGHGRGIAVLGDMLELGENADAYHRRLGERIRELQLDAVIVTGTHAHAVAAGVTRGGTAETIVSIAETHEEIADALDRMARPYDWILFKASRGMKMETSMELFRRRRMDSPVRPMPMVRNH